MFVVNNNRPAAVPPTQGTARAEGRGGKTEVAAPAAVPASPFAGSAFETRAPPIVALTPGQGRYSPTIAELDRPTTSVMVDINTGTRQGLNPAQMSTEQGIDFVQRRLAALGFAGSSTASNSTSPTSGPFRIDYGADDRRHWDIEGMNVGLVLRLYANNPPEVADRMLAADMQHARPHSWDIEGPQIPARLAQSLLPNPVIPAATSTVAASPSVASTPAEQPFAPMRIRPGTNMTGLGRGAARPLQTALIAAPGPYAPTRDELSRPTTAASLDIRTGARVPLNPQQMSTEQGLAFVQERLSALGYNGPGVSSNQTAPTVGPFGIDYGTDDRRHWDIDGMNVGLTLGLYANNPREVADRMLAAMLNQVRRPSDD